MGVEGSKNHLMLVVLDGQSVELRRRQDEKEKDKPHSMVLHIKPCWPCWGKS